MVHPDAIILNLWSTALKRRHTPIAPPGSASGTY